MATAETDLKKLEAEQTKEDTDFLEALDKEAKDFTKDQEIERILSSFKANSYEVLDLLPGCPEEDIKKVYRRKSLLIHPDKTKNPLAPDAFDRLAGAYQNLTDEKKRAKLDEAISDARMLTMRELKLTVNSERVKEPDSEFVKLWKEKVKYVLVDNEMRRQRQLKAQMQDEGRQKRKEEEEIAERKRKREEEVAWEANRDTRINSWRDFKKGQAPAKEESKGAVAPKKKVKKMKTLG